jgi:hypothetical protein
MKKERSVKHQGIDPHRAMMQMIAAKWTSAPVYVAARLGIADILAGGPKHVEDIAREAGAHAPYLYRIMRALASVGVFEEQNDRIFGLTPLAECLKDGAMRPIALFLLSDWHNQAWDKLFDCVKSGAIPFEEAHGMPCFEWLEANPEAARDFHGANAVKAAGSHSVIVGAYDFAGIGTLTDVGGGYGALLIRILEANPHLQGVVADRTPTLEAARQAIHDKGLEERCTVTQCDFFKEVPAGSDAYLLSHILHDWDDERCGQILANCRDAMRPEAKLLVVEMLVPQGPEFSVSKLLDLEVLVMGGGRERTEDEFRTLLESAGLRLKRVLPTRGDVSIMECEK